MKLETQRPDVNLQDNEGVTPLWMAVITFFFVRVVSVQTASIQANTGQLNTVQLLLSDPNIDVNLHDDFGRTALFAAVNEGRDDVVSRYDSSNQDLCLTCWVRQRSCYEERMLMSI